MAHEATPSAQADRLEWFAALALGAWVLFMRAWLIATWGSAVPFWDQWDAEALGLYQPWLNGSFSWCEVFSAHNEHRIILTRLADLALLGLAGAWDPWWQLLLNAALHALTAVALYAIIGRAIAPQLRAILLGGLALLFAAPAGWQNALWGFQSQVYFGNLLAVLALAGLACEPGRKASRWLGVLSALLALGTNGGGLLTVGASLFVLLLAIAPTVPSLTRNLRPGLGLGGLLITGWLLQPAAPQHDYLHAKTVAEFGAVLLRCLSWPWVDAPWAWWLMHLPCGWLAFSLLKARRRPDATERFLIGLVLWAGLNAVAIAWSRGGGLPEHRPLSRYQDPLVLGAAANGMLLLRLIPQYQLARSVTLLWAGCLLAGLLTLTTHVLSVNLPYKRQLDGIGLAQIRSYLVTRDSRVFASAPGLMPLHPDPRMVQQVLDDPLLSPVLPVEFREADARPPLLIRWAAWLSAASLFTLGWVAWNHFPRAKR
jgi:hypothetical protein